ncbi:phosphotransferase enzyme family protein [Aspergillus floccosus]
MDTAIDQSVLASLTGTPYACSSLHQLSGGTANFVYRGILSKPLPDGTTTVVIKHTEDFVASNRAFKIPADRCVSLPNPTKSETAILSALNAFPAQTTESITIQTPRFYHFNPETNTQIVEELPAAQDLKSFFVAQPRDVDRSWAVGVGRALGRWLKAFHAWGDDAAQAGVRDAMAGNVFMRDLKFSVNYDRLVAAVDQYPAVLAGRQEVFEAVREMARGELGREGEGVGLIHGDFWTGNVLVETDTTAATRMLVVDWELAQCGPRALDLGQMMAELYELTHYRGVAAGEWVIEGFVEGYGGISEEMAYRAAVHVGTHFIAFGSSVAGWGTEEQVQELVRIGGELVVNGWEKNRGGFGGVWECLFQ